MGTLIYRPLNATRDLQKIPIRIINLKRSLDPQAELECELLHFLVATNDRPQYEAISYTWNGQEASSAHYILCRHTNNETKCLYVTENAELVLRRLRLEHEDRYLWLDSVCIDQRSTAERNFQVRNMCYVYTFAKRVAVWLGKLENQRSRLAMEYIKKIAALDQDDDDDRYRLHELCEQIRQGQQRKYELV